ncbi:MAG: response regulator [Terriglobia bacterium]|jgi:DNA-binding NtrC family response regulator
MGPIDTNQKGRAQPLLVRRGKALLVVEDPGTLHYYCSILEGWGYQVRACHSYEEGVCCLGSEVFDFVMVSQGSRNFEGRCVVERAIEIDRRLPVLVVARCLDMGCYSEAMQLGAVDYLAEPVTVSEMGRVLENHPPILRKAA